MSEGLITDKQKGMQIEWGVSAAYVQILESANTEFGTYDIWSWGLSAYGAVELEFWIGLLEFRGLDFEWTLDWILNAAK